MADQITSAEALDALPDQALIEASGRYSDGGTFTRCWVRPVPRFIGGTSERMYEVLVYGETWPESLVSAEQIEFPATVLYRPKAATAAPAACLVGVFCVLVLVAAWCGDRWLS